MEAEAYIVEDTLPKAYQEAVRYVYENGEDKETQHRIGGNPQMTKDVFACKIRVRKPLDEPLIHRGEPWWADMFRPREQKEGVITSVPYIVEILTDAEDEKRVRNSSYTYHDRLTNWGGAGFDEDGNPVYTKNGVNQLEEIFKKIVEDPITRRTPAAIWNARTDYIIKDPPCLQMFDPVQTNGKVNLATYWRSRDLWGAWYSNARVMTILQKLLVDALQDAGVDVEVGIYDDESKSLHIYEKDYKYVENFLDKRMGHFMKTPKYLKDQYKQLQEEFVFKNPFNGKPVESLW